MEHAFEMSFLPVDSSNLELPENDNATKRRLLLQLVGEDALRFFVADSELLLDVEESHSTLRLGLHESPRLEALGPCYQFQHPTVQYSCRPCLVWEDRNHPPPPVCAGDAPEGFLLVTHSL